MQLHGFCDGSENAYGCCLFIRTTNSHRKHFANLLCAKSGVGSIKTITLPRLELSSAVLLARLVRKATNSLIIAFTKMYLRSDSTITLSWIHSDSNNWKTFVANRVAQIHELTDITEWNHVN